MQNNNVSTAVEYAQNAKIHHIKRKSGGSLSSWKLYPRKTCMRDYMVDYVYCFLTSPEGSHYFIVKSKCTGNDLSLIEASSFKNACPNSYTTFAENVNSYNSLLSDLAATIEEQKKIVESSFECDLLQPYKFNAPVDITKLPGSSDAQKLAVEIRRLFFLELEYEMATFIRTNINAENELGIFVNDYFNNRNESFQFIDGNDVSKTYPFLYNDIIDQS